MPRHPRIHAPALLYHLIARGNNGQAVFLAPADYDAFLTGLQTTRERYPFSLYAYVLMPNHFHLLLEVKRVSTGRLMQALLWSGHREYLGTAKWELIEPDRCRGSWRPQPSTKRSCGRACRGGLPGGVAPERQHPLPGAREVREEYNSWQAMS